MCKKISIFLVAIILVGFVGCANFGIAFAEEATTYSGVLDDLQKDENFKVEDYPKDSNDNSLKVIQIAESENDELFVYVYQPSGSVKDFKASSISISTAINDNISFLDYSLEFINSDDVFYKYKVVDFLVKTEDAIRYYEISTIRRPFDEIFDKPASDGNVITEVPFSVSKCYSFGEVNGNPYVNCVDIETIVITDKFVGFVRYKDGFKLYSSACDSHFVAFNTDRPIDKLLEADVYYTMQDYSWAFVPMGGQSETFKEKTSGYAYLTHTSKGEYEGSGLFAGSYSWDRIETVDDFLASENRDEVYNGAVLDTTIGSKMTDEALNELKGKKWVLRFLETDYSYYSFSTGSSSSFSTVVGDVTILRLKFVTNGIVYNLGTIDNKQTGSKDPVATVGDAQDILDSINATWDSIKDFFRQIADWFASVFDFIKDHWWIFVVVIGLIVVGILCSVAKPVWIAVKYLFIALWYVITAPLQLIVFVIRKISEKKKQ